jgi:hypothetical protein
MDSPISADQLAAISASVRENELFQRHPDSLKLLKILFNQAGTGFSPEHLMPLVYGEQKGKSKANLAVLRNHTNNLLDDFFRTSGSGFEYGVRITDRVYKLHASANPHQQVEIQNQPNAFKRFWQPYFSNAPQPFAAISSPLFFRDDQYRYIRDITINDEENKGRLDEFLGEDKSKFWQSSKHYFSAGEVMALLKLLCKFRENNVDLGYHVIGHAEESEDWEERDIISIGSARTSWHLAARQAGHICTLEESSIKLPNQELSDVEDHGHLIKYALLTRCPNRFKGFVVTMIGANHGRAAQGVAEFLTHDRELEALMEKISGDKPLPSIFQALFKVVVLSKQGELKILNTEVMETWPSFSPDSDCRTPDQV